MYHIVRFVARASNERSFNCIASLDSDIKMGSESILVIAMVNNEKLGGVRFTFTLVFQRTFLGNWDDLIHAAQQRFESEKWIDRILAYPNEIHEVPFEN